MLCRALTAQSAPTRISRYFASLRFLSDQTPSPSVPEQLRRIKQLCDDVSTVNSKTSKAEIIARYSDLQDLLEKIYDPKYRAHLTWASLQKYMYSKKGDGSPGLYEIKSVLEILEMLGDKALTGDSAKGYVYSWLETSLLGEDDFGALRETFGRLLDRNLMAGFGTNTLGMVPWPSDGSGKTTTTTGTPPSPSTSAATLSSDIVASVSPAPFPKKAVSSNAPAQSSTPPTSSTSSSKRRYTLYTPNILQKPSVALGKSLTPPFTSLFTFPRSSKAPPPKWFASRKLDGIRVLSLVDIYLPHDHSTPLSIRNIRFESRAANEFTSLANLRTELEEIIHFPKMREWLDRDDLILSETDEGVVKRMILDGEVCVMRPVSNLGNKSKALTIGDDGSGASALWVDDGLVEDFHSAVSQIKSSITVQHPVYFVFDLLSFAEFENQGAVKDVEGLGKTFGERVGEAKELVDWLNRDEGGQRRVKVLVQREVQEAEEVDKMVERATNEGWEGLILRADKPYHGKRSVDIRKFKEWQDFETKVESLDTNLMRLPVNGVFGEYEACSNIWVKFKGHPVSIGSGFSADERIQYAKDPSLMIGKEITVEYFSESKAVGRSDGTSSLRFPRIKKVWGDKRDV